MNSFLAGCACTFVVVYIYNISTPLFRELYGLAVGNGGGLGMVGLILAVGVGAWAFGKMQAESKTGAKFGGEGPGGGAAGANGRYQQQGHYAGGPPPSGYQAPPPQPGAHAPPPPQPESQSYSKAPPPSSSGWEKAREETRKREEERKRAEELKKRREEIQKAREEAERAAKIKAEQEKWEQQRAREKEKREREARERINKERLEREKVKLEQAKEAREKDAREREAREKVARDKVEWEKKRQAEKDKPATPTKPNLTPSGKYERPSAKSAAGTEEAHSYRPYDTPKKASTYNTAASSISGLSESSYAPSHSTARTTPPPSHRGPYSTSDPHKIQIKAVYLFSDKSPLRPISQLVSGQGPVTDGLVLNIETEGLFIDDDVRDVAQREWDVKAWSLKLVEEGSGKNGLHLFRACSRDVDNKKYFFILDQSEAWKVTAGVARLRKGSQVRSLGFNTIKEKDVKEVLNLVGWL